MPDGRRFSNFYGGNAESVTGVPYDELYDQYAQTRDPEDGKKLTEAYDKLVGDI